MTNRFWNIFNLHSCLKQIWQNRSLLKQMIKRLIAAKYQGSTLGILWNVIHPLMMLTIYTYVFSVVFKAKWGAHNVADSKGAFAIILFCGMTMFSIFSDAVTLSATQITGNANFVKKVVFPLIILPISQVLTSFILGLVWVVLLFIGTVFIYGNLSWSMLLLPVVWFPLLLFTLGISSCFCRCIQHL